MFALTPVGCGADTSSAGAGPDSGLVPDGAGPDAPRADAVGPQDAGAHADAFAPESGSADAYAGFDVGPLPDGSPPLVQGTWVDISPKLGNIVPPVPSGTEPSWSGEPQTGSFGQGFAFDPRVPSTLYLSIENFDVTRVGLYKSTDSGATWQRIGNLDEPIRVRVDPADSNHLYAGDGVRGSTLGFWVSTDAGKTWAEPAAWTSLPASNNNFFIDDVYDIAVDGADFNHVLVTSHSPWGTGRTDYWNGSAGVLETTDGGGSWIVHTPMSGWGAGHDIWFLGSSGSWLLGTQSAGYWRTTNSGASWTQVSTENMAHGGGQLYRTAAGTFFVSCANGVLRSSNGGATWTLASIAFSTSVYGDGQQLYTHYGYGGGAAPWLVSPESDGSTWTNYNGGAQMFTDGPFEMAYDGPHGILYSSNWGNGLWALKVP
jgi:hypothetical protein